MRVQRRRDDKATLAFKPHPTQPLKLLDGEDLKLVKKAKWEMWKRTGLLSHSDAAFWASKILEHETHGSKIVREVVRRFPLLIVDELQDTGYFLGKALLRILSEPTAQGVLVGDPDQSIFEFNGAARPLWPNRNNCWGRPVSAHQKFAVSARNSRSCFPSQGFRWGSRCC